MFSSLWVPSKHSYSAKQLTQYIDNMWIYVFVCVSFIYLLMVYQFVYLWYLFTYVFRYLFIYPFS